MFDIIIFEDMMLKQIERVLTIIQIYHLKILVKNFLTSQLIQAINLLPDTFRLCPYMKYFKIECINIMNVQKN